MIPKNNHDNHRIKRSSGSSSYPLHSLMHVIYVHSQYKLKPQARMSVIKYYYACDLCAQSISTLLCVFRFKQLYFCNNFFLQSVGENIHKYSPSIPFNMPACLLNCFKNLWQNCLVWAPTAVHGFCATNGRKFSKIAFLNSFQDYLRLQASHYRNQLMALPSKATTNAYSLSFSLILKYLSTLCTQPKASSSPLKTGISSFLQSWLPSQIFLLQFPSCFFCHSRVSIW